MITEFVEFYVGTHCRASLQKRRAGNIFSIDIDIEALADKYNSANNTDRINKIFRIDKLENLFILSTNLHELSLIFFVIIRG
jgi:hypothetical protein